MNIKVNGQALEGFMDAVIATDGSMLITLLQGERTIDEILAIFAGGAKIEVLSGDAVTATYYNKAVDSVKLGSGTVTVHIAVSKLEDDTAAEISGQIETSDGAIEELAGMAADHEARILSLEEQVAALVAASETKAQESTEAESTSESEVSNG